MIKLPYTKQAQRDYLDPVYHVYDTSEIQGLSGDTLFTLIVISVFQESYYMFKYFPLAFPPSTNSMVLYMLYKWREQHNLHLPCVP